MENTEEVKKKYKQNPKIAVEIETKKRLDFIGKKNQTYDAIINELIDLYNSDK